MLPFKLIILLVCFGYTLLPAAFGLVKEDALIARWSFDEGNGSIVNDGYWRQSTLHESGEMGK